VQLRRHQLAWITPEGWQSICVRDWDATARECLLHWTKHRLPLVVTQRRLAAGDDLDAIELGLAAPGRWDLRRIALAVSRSHVLRLGEFPSIEEIAFLLPGDSRRRWKALCACLHSLDVRAHVYGSYGWQAVTGLDHLRACSDIDVWVGVASAYQADLVAAQLASFDSADLRVDGEVVFADGTAAAWREWVAWRAGATRALLVKAREGSMLSWSIDGALKAEASA
jgi:phosphoribosyl-dephospho-CoA transferase